MTDEEYKAHKAWLEQHKKRKKEAPPAHQPNEGER